MAMIPVALAAVLALAVLVTPLVGAQPAGKTHRVGLLMPSTGGWQPKAFRETLRDLGYTEGVNLILDVRSAEGQLDRLSALAMELVRARPDVIVAVNTPGTRAAIAATTTIPIVMAVVGDPVGSGFVSSLTHPGGNVTGVSSLGGDLAGKRLSLLKQAVPAARRIAVMLPDDPMTALQVRDTERAALSIGIEVRFFPVRTTTELGSVFELMLKWRPDAALWFWGQGGMLERRTIELASKSRLPVMHTGSPHVHAGGLMSYFADITELSRRAAYYVDKILKGTKAGDLPVEQATKFELVVNMRTAKALGLTIAPSLLLQADRVLN
jgi:putative ABC transport system substrate-binding protein